MRSPFVHSFSRRRALARKVGCAKNRPLRSRIRRRMDAPDRIIGKRRHQRRKTEKERTTAMNHFKLLRSKTLWLGTIGVATMVLGWTPSCKAQEVSPAIFTDKGVEDVYPAKKPVAMKTARVQSATPSTQAGHSNQTIGRKQNAHRAARRRDVVSAPGM
jgi:hypothetical protein